MLSCGGWGEPLCKSLKDKVVVSRRGRLAEGAQMEQRRRKATNRRPGHLLEQTGALGWELLPRHRPQLLPTVGWPPCRKQQMVAQAMFQALRATLLSRWA